MFIAIGNVFSKVINQMCIKCDITSEKIRKLVWLAPEELCFRIGLSLIPPVTTKFRKIHVDFLGPILAIILLVLILNYKYSSLNSSNLQILPLESIISYMIISPLLCFMLNRIGHSWLSFLEIFVLIGYALYGYIFTLFTSVLFYSENSNASFFISLTIFGGLSTLRLVLLQIQSIPLPGARLLICSVVSVVHILFLVFLYFTYMHPNFIYGKGSLYLENKKF